MRERAESAASLNGASLKIILPPMMGARKAGPALKIRGKIYKFGLFFNGRPPKV